jgi:hypothetical protein
MTIKMRHKIHKYEPRYLSYLPPLIQENGNLISLYTVCFPEGTRRKICKEPQTRVLDSTGTMKYVFSRNSLLFFELSSCIHSMNCLKILWDARINMRFVVWSINAENNFFLYNFWQFLPTKCFLYLYVVTTNNQVKGSLKVNSLCHLLCRLRRNPFVWFSRKFSYQDYINSELGS